MRVTHLSPSGEIGGAESVILACITAGDGWPGAESSVVTLATGPFLAAAERLGARARPVEAPGTLTGLGDSFSSAASVMRRMLPLIVTFPRFFRRFSGAVSELVPQVIHSHGIKTHVLAALLPRRAPVVWHLHDYLGQRPMSSRLLRFLARRCAMVIAVSESVAADARRCLPTGLPVVVVHNSVDSERYSPEGAALDLDARSGLPPAPSGTIRIGLPATFARWKGHETFLEAIARLDRADVRAYVIGGALYKTSKSQWSERELRGIVARLGLEGRVGFTGLVADMPAAYRALDIVVHASTRPEPFGLVIPEAMSCARAVIASPAGGAAELFVPGEHAIAAAPGDATALASAIESLLDDRTERVAMGKRARAHVLASFGRERFAGDLRAVLSRLSVNEVTAAL